MKKILTLAVAFVAIVSQAASINWNISTGVRTMKDSTGEKLSGTAYLLLQSDVAAVEAAISSDVTTFLSELASQALASTDISAGKVPSTSSSGVASSSKLTAGQSYSYLFLVYDSVNQKYYTSLAVSEYAYDANSSDEALKVPKSIQFAAAEMGATSGTTASSQTFKPAVIPEPATGALALAGVALLFRRKRA